MASVAAEPSKSTQIPLIKRLLVPSLGDVLIVAILFWIFFSSPTSWAIFMGDANTGLHIRTGEWVLQHGSVPRQDPYSFSKPAGEWYAFEWLSCVVFAILHNFWGLAGIAFVGAMILVGYVLVQLKDCVDRGANALIALMIVFLGTRAAGIHFLARPHLFTIAFTVFVVWFVQRQRERETPWVWMLPVVAAVWTNFHGGFLVLPAFTGLLAGGLALEGVLNEPLRKARFRSVIRWGAVTLACCAATLVNPYGIALHRHIARFLGSNWLTSMVQEYAPALKLTDNDHVQAFFVLFAIALICVVPFVLRRQFVEPLWILFFGYMAMKSARHITIFVMVAVPIIAVQLSRWYGTLRERCSPRSVLYILGDFAREIGPSLTRVTAWGFAAGVALIAAGVPSEFSHWDFPVDVAGRNVTALEQSRLFTTDHWGDYLVYKYRPQQKIFVDGRSDYFGQEIGLEYLEMLNTDPGWRYLFARWQFNAVLVPQTSPLAKALRSDPTWHVVDEDKLAVLFLPSSR